MKIADTLAQEAQRQANGLTYTFAVGQTPSLPSDTATNLLEICKAHATLCAEAKEQATKDNDLIYHDILPSEAALPQIEKLPAAAPITIQEVYANPTCPSSSDPTSSADSSLWQYTSRPRSTRKRRPSSLVARWRRWT